MTMDTFLEDADVREIPWPKPSGAPAGLSTEQVLIADGTDALEVAIARAASRPKAEEVRRLWSLRWGRRAAPVVLVVGYQADGVWKAAVCGTKDDPAVLADLNLGQVERICAAALSTPDPANAERTLHRLLVGQKDQLVAGLTNSGLFASHELRTGVPARADWATEQAKGTKLLRQRGTELIRALGYSATSHGSTAMLLSASGTHRAVAVLLDDQEMFDRPTARFGAVSPVTQGLAIAQQLGLPWLLVTRGTQIRLYPARPEVGVGRKGQAETFTEIDLALLDEDAAAYLPLLFSADALAENGSVPQTLAASADHAAALGRRLRERVYNDVVPTLAVAVANRTQATSEADLAEAYHRTLIILFRLLFVAYAEDRGLLPYQRNPRYTRKALKTLAREFAEDPDQEFDSTATDRWEDLLAVWRAVDDGNREWGVPPYNGGLFASGDTHLAGKAIAGMQLANAEIGPALRSLLVDIGDDGTVGPVDFRSLSVREFGTIYEGLLESSLSIAPNDLTVDSETEEYRPAGPGSNIAVRRGQVYFHNASGARKATGSYFTKSFAVEHLLDTSLEPALDAHLKRVEMFLQTGDQAKASEAFFDFRVVDLAMGSGHFLVTAIDRIESRFSAFLAAHPIPQVSDELNELTDAARVTLGDGSPDVEIEPSALLRRQIARRCVYGIDRNVIAVELARLGIWIHTFVPGLPMSALDHGLVVGNSLTGIGTVEEVLDILEPKRAPGQVSLFVDQIEAVLSAARDRLLRVARTAEATKRQARDAVKAHAQALEDASDAKALLDAALGVRLGIIPLPTEPEQALKAGRSTEVQQQVEQLQAAHLPYLFPEVFLRPEGGFDVVLGNPPWERVMWEPAPYWVGVYPGLMALEDHEREAKIAELRSTHHVEAAEEKREQDLRTIQQALFKKAYTLRGGTHLELAQLMLERALRLLAPTGHLGLVLPRQSMVLAGWKNLRERLARNHDLRIVQGRNHGAWIFDGIHASYAVVLLSLSPQNMRSISVGVARSAVEVQSLTEDKMVHFTPEDLAALSETNVIPWFNDSGDRRVFDVLRTFPRLASGKGWVKATHDARWDFRGSGPDKALAVRTDAPGAWRILMTRHVDQFGAGTGKPFKQFVTDLRAAAAKKRGLATVNDAFVLTEQHPVIIVRHPSRSDDSRTLIATALPESGVLHNKGYVHAVMHDQNSTPEQRLALLGLLNTLTADWWARRFVDRHVTAPVINQIPLPAWEEDDIAQADEIVRTLLARSGAARLAGGLTVADTRPESSTELLANLERLTMRGYGLDHADLALIAADFKDKGLPLDLRTALNLPERKSE
ncbi:Eco57I restriction-modification methylase domain-containing protein [Streptomyces albidoflavus]|uniref:Eco57I restriction-modification methylase domain-containing protein n=1 Tax=Streptomyces albidoflavus TaxID=1886 RepID=UPI003CCF15A5